MSVGRLTTEELKDRLRKPQAPLLLDVRRTAAFRYELLGLPHAIPIFLDERPPRLPDLPRSVAIVVYCLCDAQVSSTRVAHGLVAAGYGDVSILEGGWQAWLSSGGETSMLSWDARRQISSWMPLETEPVTGPIAEAAFLQGVALPAKRNLSMLFVDMVDSTRLFSTHSPEQILALVQAFMEIATEVAVARCGDVHDFEGDGAMLYFTSPGDSLMAAFAIRRALHQRRGSLSDLPEVRMAIDYGPVVIGHVGMRERRGLSFVGATVHTAARLLKLAPPGGIVISESVMNVVRAAGPTYAETFSALGEPQSLKGFDEPVNVYFAPDLEERIA